MSTAKDDTMDRFGERLRPILEMLAGRAWVDGGRDQEGQFLLRPSDLAPGKSPESLHETLQALYRHARRWAPGLEVPYFVPPVRIDVIDAAGDFFIDEESYASIGVAARYVANAEAVLMILCHEACHHILMQSGIRRRDDVELDEVTTDLAMFVCGFGELVLRGHSHVRRYGRGGHRVHLGYLSSEEYRKAHDYVVARRVIEGRGLRAESAAEAKREPVAAPAPSVDAADGAVEIWCGESICKRSFRAKLRREGDPWPVQCPACGVFLYPVDILERTAVSELQPQRAGLRWMSGGRLVDGTSAAMLKLARPSDVRAPALVDNAALLEEMLASPPSPRSERIPSVRPAPPLPARSRGARPLVLAILIVAALVLVWIVWVRANS